MGFKIPQTIHAGFETAFTSRGVGTGLAAGGESVATYELCTDAHVNIFAEQKTLDCTMVGPRDRLTLEFLLPVSLRRWYRYPRRGGSGFDCSTKSQVRHQAIAEQFADNFSPGDSTTRAPPGPGWGVNEVYYEVENFQCAAHCSMTITFCSITRGDFSGSRAALSRSSRLFRGTDFA